MPVNIKGSMYRTVVERLNDMYADTNGKYTLTTKVVEDVNGTVLMKATLTLPERGIFTGHAFERENAGYINKTSHVENCETSAIGRALASAGYAGSEFASAEEVANAMKQQSAKKTETPLTKEQITNLEKAAAEVGMSEVIKDSIKNYKITTSNYKASLAKLTRLFETENETTKGTEE
tara:strand:+ start:651 stop:1184 length:534 start_codon:yes stop_codon:yes gene_type:complete